jgi:hypothetical protein
MLFENALLRSATKASSAIERNAFERISSVIGSWVTSVIALPQRDDHVSKAVDTYFVTRENYCGRIHLVDDSRAAEYCPWDEMVAMIDGGPFRPGKRKGYVAMVDGPRYNSIN